MEQKPGKSKERKPPFEPKVKGFKKGVQDNHLTLKCQSQNSDDLLYSSKILLVCWSCVETLESPQWR